MKPLFMLPFDHRSGFLRELFEKAYPPSPTVAKRVVSLKRIIYDGFLQAAPEVERVGTPAILVDEEFGLDIFEDAKKRGIATALSAEKSGVTSFAFQHGRGFGRALLRREPTYAKALVHYTVGDDELNAEKAEKLAELSDFCEEHGLGFLIEPLLHGKGTPLSRAQMMVREFLNAGIKPTVWKVEGLPKVSDWKKLGKIVKAPIIVLGRGQAKADVETWIKTAAASGAVDGFAIGRTIFMG
ncbi:MAG: DUF2090 domain-containing protein, partial [Candidatus Uhrbacteria bacterium]|nr:DUF2090 domain-containing protein [Candidatus Uhrbacteria bacterium]